MEDFEAPRDRGPSATTGTKLKGFVRDSLFYGFGDLASKVAALVIVPILSRAFAPAQYGIVDLLNVSFLFGSTVIGLNVLTGLSKFYYLVPEDRRPILVSSATLFLIGCSAAAAIMVSTFSRSVSLATFGTPGLWAAIVLSAARLPAEALYESVLLLLRLQKKAIVFSLYQLSAVVLLPATAYFFVVVVDWGLNGFFVATLCNSSALGMISLIHQRKQFSLHADIRQMFRLVKYSIPGLPAQAIRTGMDLLPRYLLGIFVGLAGVGIYGMADRLARLVGIIERIFNRGWGPFAFSNSGKQDEKALYERVYRWFNFGLIAVSLVLATFAKPILEILTPPEYHGAQVYVAGICLYYAFRASTRVLNTALYSVNKVAYTSYLQIGQLVVFLFLGLLLVPAYATTGLIISLVTSGILYFCAYSITATIHFQFPLSSFRLLAVLLSATGAWTGIQLLSLAHPSGAMLLSLSSCVLIAWLAAALAVIMQDNERRWIVRRLDRRIISGIRKKSRSREDVGGMRGVG